jgi:hypothetical protein
MGLDLKVLFPTRQAGVLSSKDIYCFDCLTFAQESRLFGQIRNMRDLVDVIPRVRVHRLPSSSSVHRFTESGLVATKTDAYGDPLTYLFATQCVALESESPANKAILAYIKALPSRAPIILMWH